MIETVLNKLEQRLGGRFHAKQRLGIETDHEAQVFGQGPTFFHIENWYSVHSVIRTLLKLTGLYWRGLANAARVQVRHNDIRFSTLPPAFDGFTLLHMSDFHADMNDGAMRRLEEILPNLSYDACVLTGDYRGATFGKFDEALVRMRPILAQIKRPVYGVLGNHDTIRMVPELAGSPCRFRSVAERPYPWRPNLSARIDPPHARGSSATPLRSGGLAISQYGRLHVDRGGDVNCDRTH